MLPSSVDLSSLREVRTTLTEGFPRLARWGLGAAFALVSCSVGQRPAPATAVQANRGLATPGDGAAKPPTEPLGSTNTNTAPPEAPADAERTRLVAWLKSRLPEGGEVVAAASGAPGIVHVARAGDSFVKIAEAYVDLTSVYFARDLNKAIHTDNSLDPEATPKPGDRIVIPSVVKRAPKSADEERLGWPEDKVLRGLYIRGPTVESQLFLGLLDRMSERGMNLMVLDAKDYDGLLTYASKVPLAVDSGATKRAPIRDLARTIRFIHERQIRVAMRISCFEDELVAKFKPSLLPLSIWKRPYPIGWFDPANPEAQAYILDLAKEAMDAGVDEIQLDYVRYPVLGIKNADFDATKGKTPKTIVIRDFVRKVHELTQSRKVPLSLDIFGIVAEGDRQDINMLGQDPALLAPECEALSPMVYPSHYRSGYQGWEIPGNHPEIVGIGTRKILKQIKKTQGAVIRPWLQAVNYKSPDYGPPYVAAEIRAAIQAGGSGWLMWNPAQTYTVTWSAVPVVSGRSAAAPSHPAKNIGATEAPLVEAR